MKRHIRNLVHFNRHVRRPLKRMGMLMAMISLMLVGVLGMAVLTADQDVDRKESGLQSFPVVAGEIIYKGALVNVDANGYLTAAADTAGHKFVGVAYEKKDNASGLDAAINCRVYTEGTFLLTCTSITQAMVGRLLYVTDDDVVDETSTNSVCVGRLVQYVSATQGWVDIGQRALSAVAGTIYGATTFNGTVTFSGVAVVLGVLYLGAGVNVTGSTILNSGLSVAGQVDLQTVYIHSQLYMAGILHFCPRVDATTLPSADPSVAGELYVDGGAVKRSAG